MVTDTENTPPEGTTTPEILLGLVRDLRGEVASLRQEVDWLRRRLYRMDSAMAASAALFKSATDELNGELDELGAGPEQP